MISRGHPGPIPCFFVGMRVGIGFVTENTAAVRMYVLPLQYIEPVALRKVNDNIKFLGDTGCIAVLARRRVRTQPPPPALDQYSAEIADPRSDPVQVWVRSWYLCIFAFFRE